jgi:glucose-1-phosphate thymidylyltransferase
MKALILAGGKGTRLRPITNSIAKHLLPVANKPLLFYILEQIRDAGINDIGIVISPETGPDIKIALADGSRWGVMITYILQSPPLGLAHAVKSAQDFVGDSSFLLFLGDNLLQEGVKGLVAEFDTRSSDALIVLKEVSNPKAFGVAEVDTSGNVIRVVEKPEEPKSNLALVGIYIFSPLIHQTIAQLQPSWRGEYEITDAIQKLLDMGKNIKSHILQGWWLDTGKKEDLLEANRKLLDERLKQDIQGDVDPQSSIRGKVEIGTGSKIENCLIRGPVSIAADCHLSHSCIGPHTSIARGVRVDNSSVEYSIILDNAQILNIPKLVESVVGRNAEITQKQNGYIGTRVFIGDCARIEL